MEWWLAITCLYWEKDQNKWTCFAENNNGKVFNRLLKHLSRMKKEFLKPRCQSVIRPWSAYNWECLGAGIWPREDNLIKTMHLTCREWMGPSTADVVIKDGLKGNSSTCSFPKQLLSFSSQTILPYSFPSFNCFNPSLPCPPRVEDGWWIVRTAGTLCRQKQCMLWSRALGGGCTLPSAAEEVWAWNGAVSSPTFTAEQNKSDTWNDTITDCSFQICRVFLLLCLRLW